MAEVTIWLESDDPILTHPEGRIEIGDGWIIVRGERFDLLVPANRVRKIQVTHQTH